MIGGVQFGRQQPFGWEPSAGARWCVTCQRPAANFMLRIIPLCCLLGITSSCARSSSGVRPSSIDPEGAAAAAVTQYDKNGDGQLDEAELTTSALKLRRWDADRDGSLTATEISQRLTKFVDAGVGLMSIRCTVLYGNAPLPDADVTFEPEEFLGGAIEPAFGKTSPSGEANMSVAEEFRPNASIEGVQIGLYKVRVTHAQADLPAKFNTETTLDIEISPIDDSPPPRFRLTRN